MPNEIERNDARSTPSRSRLVRWRSWLLCDVELAAARREHPARSAEQQAAARSARTHLRWAEEVIDTPILLRRPGWDVPADELLQNAWRYARAASGLATDETPPSQLTPALVSSLLKGALEEPPLIRSLLDKRARRLSYAAWLVVTAVALVSGLYHAAFGVNQAFGRPWRTSGQSAQFDPVTRSRGGIEQDYFLALDGGQSHWAEVDLREPTRIWGFDLRVPATYADQGTPVRLDSSLDGQRWQPIASRTTPFEHWSSWFWPRKARYVRIIPLSGAPLRLATVALR